MVIKRIIFVYFLSLICLILRGQSFWFGAKGGLNLMTQTWGSAFGSSGNRDLGFGGAFDLFIESYDELHKGSLYASLGYHNRGSAYQFVSFNNDFSARQTFTWRNAVLEVGARKPFYFDGYLDPYFTVGVRGEYTLGTNLEQYKVFNSLYYPDNAFVKKWVYGFSVGGGFESSFSEFIKFFVDVQLQPDIEFQYFQPPLFNVKDPWRPGEIINLSERQARNVTIEIKAGVRFLRKVIYE
jgi:hypothetical protein